jgi:hypothetical protein
VSDYEPVLFIEMTDGKVERIEHSRRVIHSNSKGRYVQTTSNGRVYLNEDNVAVLSWRHRKSPSGQFILRNRSDEPKEAVEDGIRNLLGHYELHVWTTVD